MIKAEINEKTTSVEVDGTVLDLASDSLNLLRSLYRNLKDNEVGPIAKLYRFAILSKIIDDDFWEPDSADDEPDD